MAGSIVAAIAQIKSEVAELLRPRLIRTVCETVGHRWRDRKFDPVTTVHLFVLQILHGNVACSQVPRLGGVDASGEAYCQARRRLPVRLLRVIVRLLSQSLERCGVLDDGRWRGHRTFHVDGSGVSLPDMPSLQKAYGQPSAQKPGCGFPVMRLVAMFHAGTGMLLNMIAAPLRTHDLSQVGPLHGELQPDDILIGDRAFCSFAHLATLAAQGILGLFRAHQKQIVDFRPHRRHATKHSHKKRRQGTQRGLPTSRWLKRLGRHDQLVEYVKPKSRPAWMSEPAFVALPKTITVRELRYQIRRRGCRTRMITLVTTLPDPKRYPASELADLYGQRWQIETNLRHLKQTLRMDVLHCQSVEGVQKELLMYALVYNLVRLVMREAAQRQGVALNRISFIDAVRWLADATNRMADLKLRLLCVRPNRLEPRVIKRRMKEFPLMTRPRADLRNAFMRNSLAA